VGKRAAVLLIVCVLGCATSAPPTPDRLSPEEMKKGPSLYETGRIGVVPPSKRGLTVDEGAIDRPPAPRAAPISERRSPRRKVRARASQAR
jgi:hypothetical protein